MEEEKQEDRILVVDDIPRNLQLLGNLLTKEGYNIAAVKDSLQVKSSVKKFKPDLVLLDVMMPDKNGFEICEELRDDPETTNIPVIFLTGKAEQEDVLEGLRAGGADYITKPFNKEELLVRVKTHLQLKKSKDKIKNQNIELQRLNATRDKLYSIIGHDMKNALFGAQGFAEMLVEDLEEMDPVPSKALEKAEFVQTSTRKIGRLLENLLDWTRLQTGRLQVENEPFSLYDVITDTIDIARSSAKLKQIGIQYEGPDEAEAIGDQRIIATVVRNLLSNAIKFSEIENNVILKLSESGSLWQIVVQDFGVGMDIEMQEDLFKSDTNLIQTGTDNEKGTGLGLILCKDLLGKYGGSIEVESEEGVGTCMITHIPKERTSEAKKSVTQTGQPAD